MTRNEGSGGMTRTGARTRHPAAGDTDPERRDSGDWGDIDLQVPNPFQDPKWPWGEDRGRQDVNQHQTVTTWSQSGESRHLARFVGFPFVGVDVGERIETAEFELCGHRWSLWVCPGGMSEENSEFVSIFLAYKGQHAPVRAWFQFTFVDPRGLRTIVFVDDEEEGSVFAHKGDHWGKHNCLLRSELHDRCPDGEFCVEVAMKCTQPSKPTSKSLPKSRLPPPRAAISVPPPSLVYDLESLLESGLASDVTFIVGEEMEEMKAHKPILIARCPVPILSEETMHLKEINVPDVDPDYFRELLRFIYTDQISQEALEEMADELLAAANRFGLARLKALAEEQLSKSVTLDNVCDLLILSKDENAPQLEEVCVSFCCQHAPDVCKTEGFQRLAAAHPAMMADLFARMGTELPPGGAARGHGLAGEGGEGGNLGDQMKAWVDLIFVNDPEAGGAQAGRTVNLNARAPGSKHEATPRGPDGSGAGHGAGQYRDMNGAVTSAPKIGSSIDVGRGKFHLL